MGDKRRLKKCPQCDGTGLDGCHNHTPGYDELPDIHKPIGIWLCRRCRGTGTILCANEEETEDE